MAGTTPSTQKEARVIMGNSTRVDPTAKPVSGYEANTVTNYIKKPGSPPAVPDSDVASARHFVQENTL